MKIDINPIDYKFSNCFEAILANIAFWKNRNFELMYVNEWDFKYKLQNKDIANPLGNSLDSFCDKRNPLWHYHGIKFTQYESSSFDNLVEIIINQILIKPITVRIDTFFFSWDKSYNKHHNLNHIIFVNGIDIEKEILYCTDPFYRICDIEVSFDCFIKGYTGKYGIFEFENDISETIDGRIIIKNLVDSLFINKVFDSIRLFASELSKIETLSNELKGYKEGWQTPLYYNISEILNSRKRVPILLSFVAKKYNYREFIDFEKELYLISKKWDMLKDLILKMFILEDISEIRKRIVNKLNEIADNEEKVANSIFSLC